MLEKEYYLSNGSSLALINTLLQNADYIQPILVYVLKSNLCCVVLAAIVNYNNLQPRKFHLPCQTQKPRPSQFPYHIPPNEDWPQNLITTRNIISNVLHIGHQNELRNDLHLQTLTWRRKSHLICKGFVFLYTVLKITAPRKINRNSGQKTCAHGSDRTSVLKTLTKDPARRSASSAKKSRARNFRQIRNHLAVESKSPS